jgi:uncharacterized membrane protein HdeD (DUF308 family)
MIEGFLLGIIATASITAGLFFLKFWRSTRDTFFLAFAASFIVEGLNRSSMLLLDRPSEGNPWIYSIRLLSLLLILAAILKKNYDQK